MALNPSALKRNSATSLFENLKTKIETKTKTYEEDTNLWKPPIDPKTKEGFAIIKFLPAKYEDDLPFVKTYRHAFQENGQWYIEECPTTIGKPCPCCEMSNKLWATGNEADKDTVRRRRRQIGYYANIYVVQDDARPENVGKVMVWRFGNAIWNQIEKCITDNPMKGWEKKDPFGFWDTVQLRFICQPNKGGFANYDDSQWETVGDFMGGDEDKLASILEQCHDLKKYTDETLYDYDRQKKRFDRVTGAMSTETFSRVTEYHPEEKQDSVPFETKPEPSVKPMPAVESTEEDDDLAYFRNLAEKAM